MNFIEPLWLLVGLVLWGGAAWVYHRADRKREVALHAFAANHLIESMMASVSPHRRRMKRGFVIAGLMLLCVALARPQAGFRWVEAQQRGVDVLFIVDVSKSMLTQDVKPDRLTRAKLAVDDLAAQLDGDRLGLIAFAGTAFLECPLTLDIDAFRETVDDLDTATIPRGGTNIAAALAEARQAFGGEGNRHTRIVVLLSDGEDLEGSALEAAKDLAKDEIKVETIGVGTANGDLIPVTDEGGGTQFVRDEAGQYVRSRLDEKMLAEIAAATGGSYHPLGARGEGLLDLYRAELGGLPQQNQFSRMQRVPLEQFGWPLAIGLLLLGIEPLIGLRRRSRFDVPPLPKLKSFRWKMRRRTGTGSGAAILIGLVVLPLFAHAVDGDEAFAAGHFAEAEQAYHNEAVRHPDRAEWQFNLGAAAYKNQRYDIAAAAFEKSLQTRRLDLQEKAYYNLGNTAYRRGEMAEKADPQAAKGAWQQSLQAYENALKLQPNDADAQFNRELVEKKLEQLRNESQRENSQSKQNSSGSNSKNNSSSSSSSSSPNPSQGQNQSPSSPSNSNSSPNGKQEQPNASQNSNPNPNPSLGQGERSSQEQASSGGAPGTPSEMTPEEAKSLLDSLRGDEKKLRLAPDAKEGEDRPPVKDW